MTRSQVLKTRSQSERDALEALYEAARAHVIAMFRYNLQRLTAEEVDEINGRFVEAVIDAGQWLERST